jgi:hypothetical protein
MQAGTMALLLAFDPGNPVGIDVAAMKADRPIRPAHRIQGFAGLIFVPNDGILENGCLGDGPRPGLGMDEKYKLALAAVFAAASIGLAIWLMLQHRI